MDNYIPKARTKIIKFNSRASVKIKDSFYTFEYGEERQIDDIEEVNLDKEINSLTNHCNTVVDKQVEEIVNMLVRN